MEKQKKLSVLIPTLNRKKYLESTIDLLIPQVVRNIDQVEFVICNNASTDKTDTYVKSLQKTNPFIKYYYFEDYVEICESFNRSILKTSGEYLLIFGDDDVPFPFFIDIILCALNSNKNIGLLNFNRLVGRDKDYSMIKLRVEYPKYCYNTKEYSLPDFLSFYALSPGFISSTVFIRSAWEMGLPYHTKRHYGYEFLGIIYNGIKGLNCIYSDYPMVIQRNPYSRDWIHDFPLFNLIGIPNLMSDLDKWQLSDCALDKWNKTVNKSFMTFCYILFVASAYKNQYKPLCKEINYYQSNLVRKCMTYILIYTIPSSIYKWFRKIMYK